MNTLNYDDTKYNTIIECATLMITYNWSVRTIAENLDISKSTVHDYLTKELPYIDDDLYMQCKHIMHKHKI